MMNQNEAIGANGRLRSSKIIEPNHRNTRFRKSDAENSSKPSKPATSVTNSGQHLCLYCNKTFALKQSLTKHTNRLHKRLSSSSENIILECLYCKHINSDQFDILNHMIDGHSEKYFACAKCRIRFPTREQLDIHNTSCQKQTTEERSTYKRKLRQRFNHASTSSYDDIHVKNEINYPISCEIKPTQVEDADIENNITTNVIIPSIKVDASQVINDIVINKNNFPKLSSFSYHNTESDQILSRLGVVHRSPNKETVKHLEIENGTSKFKKCFDRTFFSKVSINIDENLTHFLDGSLNYRKCKRFNEQYTFKIKYKKSLSNAVEGFPVLLAPEQCPQRDLNSTIHKIIAPKHKFKWSNPETYEKACTNNVKTDSHSQNCIITAMSQLDIWTQLQMKQRFDIQFGTNIGERNDRNNILDEELRVILESKEIPKANSYIVAKDKSTPTNNPFAFLGLTPTLPTRVEEPAVLSGEWARPRKYICRACGDYADDSKSLTSHISLKHPNAQVDHYEVVGEHLLSEDIMKHLYIPSRPIPSTSRPRRGNKSCTKCNKSISLDNLHDHILECAGDIPVARRKSRSRLFGVRRRRPRLPENTSRKRPKVPTRPNRKDRIRPRPKRSELGDGETIRKMLADLPAKRHRIPICSFNISKINNDAKNIRIRRRLSDNKNIIQIPRSDFKPSIAPNKNISKGELNPRLRKVPPIRRNPARKCVKKTNIIKNSITDSPSENDSATAPKRYASVKLPENDLKKNKSSKNKPEKSNNEVVITKGNNEVITKGAYNSDLINLNKITHRGKQHSNDNSKQGSSSRSSQQTKSGQQSSNGDNSRQGSSQQRSTNNSAGQQSNQHSNNDGFINRGSWSQGSPNKNYNEKERSKYERRTYHDSGQRGSDNNRLKGNYNEHFKHNYYWPQQFDNNHYKDRAKEESYFRGSGQQRSSNYSGDPSNEQFKNENSAYNRSRRNRSNEGHPLDQRKPDFYNSRAHILGKRAADHAQYDENSKQARSDHSQYRHTNELQYGESYSESFKQDNSTWSSRQLGTSDDISKEHGQKSFDTGSSSNQQRYIKSMQSEERFNYTESRQLGSSSNNNWNKQQGYPFERAKSERDHTTGIHLQEGFNYTGSRQLSSSNNNNWDEQQVYLFEREKYYHGHSTGNETIEGFNYTESRQLGSSSNNNWDKQQVYPFERAKSYRGHTKFNQPQQVINYTGSRQLGSSCNNNWDKQQGYPFEREKSDQGHGSQDRGSSYGHSKDDINNLSAGYQRCDESNKNRNSPKDTIPNKVPLKHSIEKITQDLHTTNRTDRFPHSTEEPYITNFMQKEHLVGRKPFFEHQSVNVKVYKPPLVSQYSKHDPYAYQKIKQNKPRKGLNDCIAMLKNKLFEPIPSTSMVDKSSDVRKSRAQLIPSVETCSIEPMVSPNTTANRSPTAFLPNESMPFYSSVAQWPVDLGSYRSTVPTYSVRTRNFNKSVVYITKESPMHDHIDMIESKISFPHYSLESEVTMSRELPKRVCGMKSGCVPFPHVNYSAVMLNYVTSANKSKKKHISHKNNLNSQSDMPSLNDNNLSHMKRNPVPLHFSSVFPAQDSINIASATTDSMYIPVNTSPPRIPYLYSQLLNNSPYYYFLTIREMLRCKSDLYNIASFNINHPNTEVFTIEPNIEGMNIENPNQMNESSNVYIDAPLIKNTHDHNHSNVETRKINETKEEFTFKRPLPPFSKTKKNIAPIKPTVTPKHVEQSYFRPHKTKTPGVTPRKILTLEKSYRDKLRLKRLKHVEQLNKQLNKSFAECKNKKLSLNGSRNAEKYNNNYRNIVSSIGGTRSTLNNNNQLTIGSQNVELPNVGHKKVKYSNSQSQNKDLPNIDHQNHPNSQPQNVELPNTDHQKIYHPNNQPHNIELSNMDQQKTDHPNNQPQNVELSNIDNQKVDHSNVELSNTDHQKTGHPNNPPHNVIQLKIDHQNIDHPNRQLENVELPNFDHQKIYHPSSHNQNVEMPDIDHQKMDHPNEVFNIDEQKIEYHNGQPKNVELPNIDQHNYDLPSGQPENGNLPNIEDQIIVHSGSQPQIIELVNDFDHERIENPDVQPHNINAPLIDHQINPQSEELPNVDHSIGQPLNVDLANIDHQIIENCNEQPQNNYQPQNVDLPVNDHQIIEHANDQPQNVDLPINDHQIIEHANDQPQNVDLPINDHQIIEHVNDQPQNVELPNIDHHRIVQANDVPQNVEPPNINNQRKNLFNGHPRNVGLPELPNGEPTNANRRIERQNIRLIDGVPYYVDIRNGRLHYAELYREDFRNLEEIHSIAALSSIRYDLDAPNLTPNKLKCDLTDQYQEIYTLTSPIYTFDVRTITLYRFQNYLDYDDLEIRAHQRRVRRYIRPLDILDGEVVPIDLCVRQFDRDDNIDVDDSLDLSMERSNNEIDHVPENEVEHSYPPYENVIPDVCHNDQNDVPEMENSVEIQLVPTNDAAQQVHHDIMSSHGNPGEIKTPHDLDAGSSFKHIPVEDMNENAFPGDRLAIIPNDGDELSREKQMHMPVEHGNTLMNVLPENTTNPVSQPLESENVSIEELRKQTAKLRAVRIKSQSSRTKPSNVNDESSLLNIEGYLRKILSQDLRLINEDISIAEAIKTTQLSNFLDVEQAKTAFFNIVTLIKKRIDIINDTENSSITGESSNTIKVTLDETYNFDALIDLFKKNATITNELQTLPTVEEKENEDQMNENKSQILPESIPVTENMNIESVSVISETDTSQQKSTGDLIKCNETLNEETSNQIELNNVLSPVFCMDDKPLQSSTPKTRLSKTRKSKKRSISSPLSGQEEDEDSEDNMALAVIVKQRQQDKLLEESAQLNGKSNDSNEHDEPINHKKKRKRKSKKSKSRKNKVVLDCKIKEEKIDDAYERSNNLIQKPIKLTLLNCNSLVDGTVRVKEEPIDEDENPYKEPSRRRKSRRAKNIDQEDYRSVSESKNLRRSKRNRSSQADNQNGMSVYPEIDCVIENKIPITKKHRIFSKLLLDEENMKSRAQNINNDSLNASQLLQNSLTLEPSKRRSSQIMKHQFKKRRVTCFKVKNNSNDEDSDATYEPKKKKISNKSVNDSGIGDDFSLQDNNTTKTSKLVCVEQNGNNKSDLNEEQIKSDQFMESFGFFSERKPRKSNLMAIKKISETFNKVNESDEVYFSKNKYDKKTNSSTSNLSDRKSYANESPLSKTVTNKSNDDLSPPPSTVIQLHKKANEINAPECGISPNDVLDENTINIHVKEELNRRDLSCDQALFIDCCEMLKESHKNDMSDVGYFDPAVVLDPFVLTDGENNDRKSEGDVDSLTAKNILESEEVRNLENDLISGLKESTLSGVHINVKSTEVNHKASTSSAVHNPYDNVNMSTNLFDIPMPSEYRKCTKEKVTEEIELLKNKPSKSCSKQRSTQKQSKQHKMRSHHQPLNKDLDNDVDNALTSKTTVSQTQVNVIQNVSKASTENYDVIFEDKFDKIKRKSRSLAAAAKIVEPVLVPKTKSHSKKKSSKHNKSIIQHMQPSGGVVLTKGALKGFEGVKVSIPTSQIDISRLMPPKSDRQRKLSKKKMKNTSRRRKTVKASEVNEHCSSNDLPDKITEKRKGNIDVYEFMDNDETEMTGFRTSTRLENSNITKKLSHNSTKSHVFLKPADETQDSIASGSDGDDFVYMSDDYACSSADESHNRELVNTDNHDLIKTKSKSCTAVKSVAMGKIFKNNVYRETAKRDISPFEPSVENTANRRNLDLLFDQLLRNEPSTSNSTTASMSETIKMNEFSDGVARQRERRKCTVGKQNILAETWSSESEADELTPIRVAGLHGASAGRKKKSKKNSYQHFVRKDRHISFRPSNDKSKVNCDPTGNIRTVHSQEKRSLDNIKDNNKEQRGWICGGNHKLLVSLLAQAKRMKEEDPKDFED